MNEQLELPLYSLPDLIAKIVGSYHCPVCKKKLALNELVQHTTMADGTPWCEHIFLDTNTMLWNS
jgi:hypothetical protein